MSCLLVFSSLFELEKSILGRKSTVKSHLSFQRPNKRYCLHQVNDVEIGDDYARLLMWKTLYSFNRGNFFQIVLNRMTCSSIYYTPVFVSL